MSYKQQLLKEAERHGVTVEFEPDGTVQLCLPDGKAWSGDCWSLVTAAMDSTEAETCKEALRDLRANVPNIEDVTVCKWCEGPSVNGEYCSVQCAR